MRKLILISFLLAAIAVGSFAMTPKDSVQIVTANWSPERVRPGIVHKHAPFKFLYGAPQNIHIVEVIPTRKKNKVNLLVNEPHRKTSESASSVNAVAAINGSYFDMKNGGSVCYLKLGPDVIDTTTSKEFNLRVNGAVRIDRRGNLSLIPWNRMAEKNWADDTDIVIASGPLMVHQGEVCDFSQCDSMFIHRRHPRSAIGMTHKGTILLVTVDGRHPVQAAGMSIPEFAWLMKLLGCRQALNLDGGGSTTLWINDDADGSVVNMPSDNKTFDHEGERKVSNILYIR